jgi:alkylation response protein AidB-like acyl-CoA dehydrogenase
MSKPNSNELNEFAKDADKWFAENTPKHPGFMLPLTFMEVGTDEQFDFLCAWQKSIYDAGFLGAAWPSEYGGGGLTQDFQTAATKAMRAHGGPILLNAIGLNWAGPLILDRGTEAHKKAYIKGILNADDIWCQGFSEPENGSDLGNAQTKAVKDGDEYIVNGSKIWTTHGHYAKHMILLARTDSAAKNKYAGLSFFLAPMNAPGIETTKIKKLTGEHGFTQTFFTDARIPADGLIGKEGEGWLVAMQTLEYERGARVGQAGGYVAADVDPFAVADLAKTLERGGKPVMDDPVLRARMVEFVIEAQSITLNAQRRKLAPLNEDYPNGLPLISKLVSTEFRREVSAFAIQLQGPKGVYYQGDDNAVDAGLWQRSYYNAFSATIGGGTSQIQRNIIGEHVLGLPKTR